MTTLLFLFLISLGLSLVLTPLTKKFGIRLGAVDEPAERQVHAPPIPRIGGLAVFLAFTITMAVMNLHITRVSELFVFDRQTAFGLYGALIVFGCGLWDDFRQLNPWIKLLFQILGATVAFAGGISIGGIVIREYSIQFGVMSYAVTVFWFVLFINAVNMIDGLDGLAGGVVFFTCLLMVILSVMRADYLPGIYFAALGGSVLGFLRYNFNPASIFLGDGGSYFLGYAVAALSIMGSVKSQVGALMLIPLLALGVPVFDAMLAPLRRWMIGKQMFRPDRGHIHHRLLAMGLSSRKAVLILYGVTLVLCLLAILLANFRNEVTGLVLVILGGVALIMIRKTGYLEYLAIDKFYGWVLDMADVVGLSRERRTFLALQIEMNRARTMEDLCVYLGEALEMLKFDRAELHLRKTENRISIWGKGGKDSLASDLPMPERRNSPGGGALTPSSKEIFQDILRVGDKPVWNWTRGYYRRKMDITKEEVLKIDLPLSRNGNGERLILMKDLARDPLQYYTFRRLEQLRRTLRSNLSRLHKVT